MNAQLILIIEDNALNRKLVRDVLQAKGYRTLETETAEEGVRLAREHLPALVLMDIQLPGMNGIEALDQLRADPVTQAIPVIAVTASAMTQNRQQIMRLASMIISRSRSTSRHSSKPYGKRSSANESRRENSGGGRSASERQAARRSAGRQGLHRADCRVGSGGARAGE